MASTCASTIPTENPEVRAAQLEAFVSFGHRNAARQLGDVPTVLDQFQRVLDDYDEATGDSGINDQIKNTINAVVAGTPQDSHAWHAHGGQDHCQRGHA